MLIKLYSGCDAMRIFLISPYHRWSQNIIINVASGPYFLLTEKCPHMEQAIAAEVVN